jgi:hypothetical protein
MSYLVSVVIGWNNLDGGGQINRYTLIAWSCLLLSSLHSFTGPDREIGFGLHVTQSVIRVIESVTAHAPIKSILSTK